METKLEIEEPINIGTKNTFFKHVFTFDEHTKSELMNIIQYSIFAFIPIILLSNTLKSIFPEYDSDKGNVELLAEILGHITILLIGVFFIHRFVTYFPTYSGKNYQKINIFSALLVFLILLFNSKQHFTVGDSVDNFYNRMKNYWNGTPSNKTPPTNNEEPVAKLPHILERPKAPRTENHPAQVDFDSMYNNKITENFDTTGQQQRSLHQVNARGGAVGVQDLTDTQQQFGFAANEPMAANEILGSSGVSF